MDKRTAPRFCARCGKATAGALREGGLWTPRRHKLQDGLECPGSYEAAVGTAEGGVNGPL